MRPGHDKARARAGFLLTALFACSPSWAQAQSEAGSGHAGGEVRFCDPHDAELLARIQGQAHDLPATLHVIDCGASPFDAGTASVQLQGRSARALVWVDALPDGAYRVTIAQPRASTVLTREVPAARADDALAASATRETVALVVRSELLQALAAAAADGGGTTAASGAGSASDASKPAAGAAAASSKRGPSESSASEQGSDSASSFSMPRAPLHRLRLSLGWQPAWAGSDHLAHALAARAALGFDSLEVALGAAAGFPETLSSTAAAARISRHTFDAALLFVLPLGEHAQLAGGAFAGVVLFSRSTPRASGTLAATPDTFSPALAFGPLAVLRLRLLAQAGVELGLRADLVPAAPRYAVEKAGIRSVVAHERVLEPAALAGIFWAP